MGAHDVVITGGGPTGMMLAAELSLAGVDVAVLERRPDHELAGSRAAGFHSRTIEVLDQRGVAERFLAEGQRLQAAGFGTARLDMSDFPTRHPYSLAIPQRRVEQIMGEWLAELPVRFDHEREVTGFAQDVDGVEIEVADGEPLRAAFLVGCDGGRSLIRKAAGIDFPGWEATRSNLIAEVRLADEPPQGVHRDAAGVHGFHRLQDGETLRVVTTERAVGPDAEPELADLRASLVAAFGTDFGVHDPAWISRFTDATRQAAAYRSGRVLLAGDAAHVHYPVGGQGLSLGVQDAVNLGWKLARTVKGTAPGGLLDSYHAERHPVGARVLRHTMAMAALQRTDDRMEALTEIVSELAVMDEPRKRLAGLASGLDIRYDLGEGHPLLGRRMPDLDLGPRRVYEYLHRAEPVLLNFSGVDLASAHVQAVEARYDGPWELPVIGEVTAPAAVLIRPDGYVAWVGDGADDGLADAVRTWFA